MSTPSGPQDPNESTPSEGYGATPPSPPSYGSTPADGGYGATPPPPPPSYGYGGGTPAGPPPNNYLVWAILTTVLCCLPLGVASIVFSTQVNSKWAAGDYAGAQESAEKAKKFAIWSAIAAAIVLVLYIIFVVVLGVGGALQANSY